MVTIGSVRRVQFGRFADRRQACLIKRERCCRIALLLLQRRNTSRLEDVTIQKKDCVVWFQSNRLVQFLVSRLKRLLGATKFPSALQRVADMPVGLCDISVGFGVIRIEVHDTFGGSQDLLVLVGLCFSFRILLRQRMLGKGSPQYRT